MHHDLGFSSLLQCFIECLYYFDRHGQTFGVLFGHFETIMKILTYLIIERNLKIINFHKLLPHNGRLSLPRRIFRQGIPQRQQIKQFIINSQIFSLIF